MVEISRRDTLRSALAVFAVPSVSWIPSTVTYQNPEIHISYGQSWRTNSFPDFGTFGINTQAGAFYCLTVPADVTGVPGELPNGAGIFLPSIPNGVTTYLPTDWVSIGRCAVQANQLLRAKDGTHITPIIEYCAAYPASTWTTGGGGGLEPGVNSFVASVTDDTMTVTSVADHQLNVSQTLVAAGLNANTIINSYISGTGQTGTYGLAVKQSVINEPMTTDGAGAFVGQAQIDQTVLTVTGYTSGTILVGAHILGQSVAANTRIVSQLSGTTGQLGQYSVTIGPAQSVGSETMRSLGQSWYNMTLINAAIPAILPTGSLSTPRFKSFGYTQADSADNTLASKEADLTDMMVEFDALNLPGGPLKGYFGYPASPSESTVEVAGWTGTFYWLQTNAPGQGGPYSGRVFGSTPWYMWQFEVDSNGNPVGDIHTGAYGTCRHGELEGYVRHQVEDLGVMWTPLWLSLTSSITLSGQTITIPFDRPNSADFVNSVMSFQNNADDGLFTWPNQGFNVWRNGVGLTVTPVISGTNVVLTISETLQHNDSLEVSYAHRGPGDGDAPASLYPGIGGNLVMQGPPSVLFPNGFNGVSKTIDAWAWPFSQTIVVP